MSHVNTLAAFGTRHSLSDTQSETRGIGAARRWIKTTFDSFGGSLSSSFEEFDAPRSQRLPDGARIVNVVATLQGTMPEARGRTYYVVGHYDSINADRMDPVRDAPGANDDASGTAVVIEIARVLAHKPLESTVVFLCTAAEEQGLIGAKFHAESAKARGVDIRAVLNNDIVGDPSVPFITPSAACRSPGPTSSVVRVFSEAMPRNPSTEELAKIRSLASEHDSPSRQLARFVAYVARTEKTAIQPMLVFRLDRFLRGGDHSAFNEAGFAAVRFTVPAEDYSRQHADVTERDGKPYGDVPSFVDGQYVANIARLNAATLIHLANAPSTPRNCRVITARLTTGTTMRWEASPEPDVRGYEVVWRLTTSPDWEGVADAGNSLEWSTDASKDNYFFGVRAYDKDGYRSPVAFAGASEK